MKDEISGARGNNAWRQKEILAKLLSETTTEGHLSVVGLDGRLISKRILEK
jgi:hypothetical protein